MIISEINSYSNSWAWERYWVGEQKVHPTRQQTLIIKLMTNPKQIKAEKKP